MTIKSTQYILFCGWYYRYNTWWYDCATGNACNLLIQDESCNVMRTYVQ